MVLIATLRNSASSGEDKDYNARRNSSIYSIQKALWELRGLCRNWRKPGLLPFRLGLEAWWAGVWQETNHLGRADHIYKGKETKRAMTWHCLGLTYSISRGGRGRVSATWGWRCILHATAYGAGLPLFSLRKAIDRYKAGNDVGSSPLMLILFSLFLWVGMPPLRAEEEKSLAVMGIHRYPLS